MVEWSVGAMVGRAVEKLRRVLRSFDLVLSEQVWSSESRIGYPRMLVEIGIRLDNCAFVSWSYAVKICSVEA